MNLGSIKKAGLITGLFLVLSAAAAFVAPATAQNADPFGVKFPSRVGLSNTDVRVSTAKMIRISLSLLGVVFLVITLYGGYEWMTSAGNNEQVAQAKKRIYTGIIGLAIILASYSITYYVVLNLTNITSY